MNDMPTLLRDLRTRANLKAKEAADAIGVHPATVWAWESGEREPDKAVLRRVIEVYGPTPDERARLIELRALGSESAVAVAA